MAITLIVEDGTGKPDANTYITVAEARVYAANRGVTLSDNDDVVAASLISAVDYMETKGPYKGELSTYSQSLSFPRKGLEYRGVDFPSNTIPQKVKDAQAQLVLDIKESGALMSSKQQYALKKRVLEGLTQEFAVGSYAAYAAPTTHKLYDSLMSAFVAQGSTGSYVIR